MVGRFTIANPGKMFRWFVIAIFIFVGASLNPLVGSATPSGKVVYTIDFTGQKNADAEEWLKKKGFIYKLDADKLNARLENGSLVISTDDDISGLFVKKFNKKEYIRNVKRIRISWGVHKYPQEADWANGNNRVPIAVTFSFGTLKIANGMFVVPNAPYFLSAFIGLKETKGQMYLGKLFTKGGRYFCVASGDQTGKIIVTDFEVDDRFKESFKLLITPPITAFSFQMNTKNTQGGAKAFLKKIEFISE